MSWLGAMAAGWLLRVALGGGVILLLTSLTVRLTAARPAARRRMGPVGGAGPGRGGAAAGLGGP